MQCHTAALVVLVVSHSKWTDTEFDPYEVSPYCSFESEDDNITKLFI